MEIEKIKQTLKEKKMTYEDLSIKTNLSISTIKKILSGSAKYPRVDTVEIIEKALGITSNPINNLSEAEKELVDLVSSLTEDEIEEMSNFVKFIISKRK